MSETVPEYCPRCQCVQPVKAVRGPMASEWSCAVCHYQHDVEFYDDEDDNEPVGSCDNCGTNLYPHDDDVLCDQCLWHVQRFGRMR